MILLHFAYIYIEREREYRLISLEELTKKLIITKEDVSTILTLQQESLATRNGSQDIPHNNTWSQPFVLAIWPNNRPNPFLPA